MIDYLETLLEKDEEQWAKGFALETAVLHRGQRKTVQKGGGDALENNVETLPETAQHMPRTFDGLREALMAVSDWEHKAVGPENNGKLRSTVLEVRGAAGTVGGVYKKQGDTAALKTAPSDETGVSRARERVEFTSGVLEEREGGGREAAALYRQIRGQMSAATYVRREVPTHATPLEKTEPVTRLSSSELDRLCERDARRYDGGFALL